MKELLTVKANVDRLLDIQPQQAKKENVRQEEH